MKKLIALLLVLATALSLFACAKEENATTTMENEPVKEEVKKTEEKKEEAEATTEEEDVVYNHKADVTNIREKLAAIPIANASMTTDQLRQICVDYLQLSVSFQWIPDRTFSYADEDVKKFYNGKLEGGIPYINTASGNLYRWLEFYDDETGVVDCSQIEQAPKLFGTACSGSAGWAWARVINSAEITWTSEMNVAHGFVIVGDYTYDTSIETMWHKTPEGNRVYNYKASEVCKQNGRQVMYESYAKTLLADCYSSNGHVRMLVEPVHVVRNADGTIDGDQSYATLGEQGLYNTGDAHTRYTADGTSYQIRGQDAYKHSFTELFDTGYLVHTFKEFLGTDPVEAPVVSIPFTGDAATAEELATGILTANYCISDVLVKVFGEDGSVKMDYKKRMTSHFTKATSLTAAIPASHMRNLAKEGNCTCEISVQLSTGEIVTAYSGKLLASK